MELCTEPDLIKSSPQVGNVTEEDFGPNLIRLRVTQQVKELQTVIRDKYGSVLMLFWGWRV